MQTFKKEERLSKDKIIDQLFKEGKSFLIFPLRIVWFENDLNTEFPAQVLISVPKKKIRKAVNRNLIKRRIREAYRKNKSSLYEILNKASRKCTFAIIYTSSEIACYKELEQKIILSLQRLQSEYENDNR